MKTLRPVHCQLNPKHMSTIHYNIVPTMSSMWQFYPPMICICFSHPIYTCSADHIHFLKAYLHKYEPTATSSDFFSLATYLAWHLGGGISTPSMTSRAMYSSAWYSTSSGFCLEPETFCTGFPHYEYYSYFEIKLRTLSCRFHGYADPCRSTQA